LAGYHVFPSLTTLASADLNDYLMKQTFMKFASESARDTALASDRREGMVAYLDDKNWTTYFNGANWLLLGGRLGVVATGSTQSIPNSTNTAVSWDGASNINDTFITPTSNLFTIPTSSSTTRGGRYTIVAKANLASATSGYMEIQAAGESYDYGFNSSSAPAACVPGLEIASGSLIQIVIRQTSGAAMNCNFKVSIWYEAPSS
jgi:hypothetical protein